MVNGNGKKRMPSNGTTGKQRFEEDKHWRSRIVGHDEVPPDQLVANPGNWRVHPGEQQGALLDVLHQIGWVQQVVVNTRTGNVVDGHLRVMLALRNEEPSVPVVYIDVSDEEEKLVLATLDPLSAMAVADATKLGELLDGLTAQEGALGEMLDRLRESVGLLPPNVEFKEYNEDAGNEVEHITCPNCGHTWPK